MSELDQLREENARLKAELAECKRDIVSLHSELETYRQNVVAAMPKGGEG